MPNIYSNCPNEQNFGLDVRSSSNNNRIVFKQQYIFIETKATFDNVILDRLCLKKTPRKNKTKLKEALQECLNWNGFDEGWPREKEKRKYTSSRCRVASEGYGHRLLKSNHQKNIE